MRTVVITSLSPATDLDHQLRCLAAWGHLGLTVRTANNLRACEMLRAADVPEHLCLPIPPRETSLNQDQTPAPRLVPLLRRIATDFVGHRLMLTRPGVYPALRSADCLDHWLDYAPALALCVEDTPLLERYQFSDRAPRHDQVDAFLIAPAQITALIGLLSRWPVAEEMCLGDAGWDLLLTAAICADEIGGLIAESSVLLSETNAAYVPGRQALGPFIPALRALELAQAPDAQSAAEDCAGAITASCANHAALSAQSKAFYFAPPSPLPDPPPAATAIARQMLEQVPWTQWNYDIALLTTLTMRIMAPDPFSFDRIMAVLNTGPNAAHQVSETLLALVLWGQCRPEAATALRGDFTATPAPAMVHRQSLQRLQADDDTDVDLACLRLELVTLAARMIIDHGIWTAGLHDALRLSCQNDTDRMLFDTLVETTRKVADAA